MYKNVIYVVNEVKGVTEQLKTSIDFNVVRDYAGNGKSFTRVSLEQINVPTVIITNNHTFETDWVEIPGGQRRFKAKTSTAIRIASNLYKRGITTTLKDYKGNKITRVTIEPNDNLYKKIDEFCGMIDKKSYHFEKMIMENYDITWESFAKAGLNPFQLFPNKEAFTKTLKIFHKYAEVYGLDAKSELDMYTFMYINKHKEIAEDYMDGTKFICPCCQSVVRVNGYEKFINGKPINMGKTVCETCYTSFKVHDKRDVLRLARYVAKQK